MVLFAVWFCSGAMAQWPQRFLEWMGAACPPAGARL